MAVVFGFDAAHVVDLLDARVVVEFHLAVYLVIVPVLNPLGGIEGHVDVVLLIPLVFQEVLIKLVHLGCDLLNHNIKVDIIINICFLDSLFLIREHRSTFKTGDRKIDVTAKDGKT